MRLSRTMCSVLPLVTSSLAFGQAGTPELRAALQERLDAYIEAGEVPGVSAGVVLPDGELVRLVAGVSDLETGRKLEVDDRLLAGSTGKTFVAAVALQLVEEGELELDALVGETLGTEEWYGELANAESLTLRHLMSHRSGLSRYVFDPGFVAALKAEPERVWKPAELVEYVLGIEALFEAGEGFAYSDINYVLVGMMIEAVTGASLYGEARERLLQPLKLEGVVPSDSRVIARLVQGHCAEEDPLGLPRRTLDAEGRFCINPQFEWAGGGFATTAGDLARWAHALYLGEVLGGALRGEMLAGRPADQLGPGVEYGLGAFVRGGAEGPVVGHAGFMPGYMTEVRCWLDGGLTVAVQVNSSDPGAMPGSLGDLTEELAAIVRAAR